MNAPRLVMSAAFALAIGCGDKGDDASTTAGSGGSMTSSSAGAGAMNGGHAGAGSGSGGASAAAGSGGNAAGSGGAPSFVPGSATFSAIYTEIMVGKGCTGSPLCHAGSSGGLTLSQKQAAYDALVDKPAMGVTLMPPNCRDSGLKRVVPGDPDHSLLLLKIEDMQPCGSVMPPNPPMLDASEVMQVRQWIADGAHND